MRKIFAMLTISFLAMSLYGQGYNTAIGLKFGDDLKFSLNQRIANKLSVEANFSDGLFSDHKYVSLALKRHYPIFSKSVNIFLGAGYYGQSHINGKDEIQNFDYNNKGLLGMIGGEVTIGRLNISMDFTPQYALNKDHSGRKLSSDSAISAKYVLWKRQSKTKKLIKKIF
jgi:hypothetical protein